MVANRLAVPDGLAFLKPYKTRPMFGMLISQNLGEGVLLWWWALVVSDRTSLSCYRPSICKAIRYLLRFCRSFEVKFWFPQFGGMGALWRWAFAVSDGALLTSY